MHAVLMCLALVIGADDAAVPLEMPVALDERIAIELFAADPDIVTPTGLAVDDRGRVFVVESHTHFPLEDYPGLKTDRVRMFEDTDGDGRADRITTFFEGTTWTMNLGIHPDGSIYVATRNEVFRLRDTDGDGKADERTPIAHLETKGDYPHNGLSGFAFDFAGNVYFGLGENKGEFFKLIGTDGSTASELEGGQIYRCRADGTSLEMLSFGFWNPFHLAFDTFERLFVVDNDPDSMPPCRLVHIVPGGNYGYRYRNGRKGVHPFTAWNGELPGTLPMVAGTGEAPSGIIAYESDHLPSDYVGDLLVTSWGDHRIDRFRALPRGASFHALPTAIVRGGENFRPVGIATAPDGSLYVSDWVLKSYNVHGKGRIWHIRAKKPQATARPSDARAALHAAHRPLREQAARKLAADPKDGRKILREVALGDENERARALAVTALASVGELEPVRQAARRDRSADVRALAVRSLPVGSGFDDLVKDASAEVRAEALRRTSDPSMTAVLWKNVADSDAFLAEAARVGLARVHAVTAETDFANKTAVERLAALLILRESHDPKGRQALARLLRDPDASVRFAAIQWVGEERLTDFRQPLVDALSVGPASSRLFGGYLAALERLDGVVRESSNEWAGEQYIIRALDDPQTSPEVRRWSVRMLRPDHPALSIERLKGFLASGDAALQLEAVRTLRDSPHFERGAVLREIAGNASYSTRLRAEAIVGLSPEEDASRSILMSLAQGDDRSLRNEALRSLAGASLVNTERDQLKKVTSDDDSRELVARVLEPGVTFPRPAAEDLAGWLKLVGGPDRTVDADVEAGERIFFHHRFAGCSNCHQMLGRGARVGPELTATAGTFARERLIESIVRPSKEIAPQFATWLVVTAEGKSLTGVLVKQEATGEQTYADQKGQLFEFKPGEIEMRKLQPLSIMPDGLANQLSVQEFRDLLAYLQIQAGAGR